MYSLYVSGRADVLVLSTRGTEQRGHWSTGCLIRQAGQLSRLD